MKKKYKCISTKHTSFIHNWEHAFIVGKYYWGTDTISDTLFLEGEDSGWPYHVPAECFKEINEI